MQKVILLSAIAASAAIFAATGTHQSGTTEGAPDKPSFHELITRQGGFVIDTRAQKGRLVVVNAQSEIKSQTVTDSTKAFEKDSKIRIDHETGSFDLKLAKRIGEATVYVISDETLPVVMIAADDRWGFVNVAKLRTDKAGFFNSRVRKEIVRVAGFLLGAGDSFPYPLCLTGHVKDLNYLDSIPNEQLPYDVMQRVIKSMDEIGITQYRKTTYKTAVEEGWAPAPTNEYQKAIWDKVHAMPTEPLKIAPETTKQK